MLQNVLGDGIQFKLLDYSAERGFPTNLCTVVQD